MMVVYSIVRALKGTIEVQSEVGIDTTFEMIFSISIPIYNSNSISHAEGIQSIRR